MIMSLLSSLLIGFVTGSLWRIAVTVALAVLIIWGIRNAVVRYQDRTFIGRGALILSVLGGFLLSSSMRSNTVPKLQAEIKAHKAAIEDCVVARDDAVKQIDALKIASKGRDVAIAEAEKRARHVEKIAGQTAKRVYRGTKVKATIETKSAETLNAWFADTLSEYKAG
jgi:ABC-type nickel/cobalt efflux system permease component RcnA